MEYPTEFKKTEQAGATLLISLIIILALVFLVIKPQTKSLRGNNLDVALKKTEFKEKEEKVANLKDLETKISEAESTVKKLAIALPKGIKVGEVLVQLEAMAITSGVTLTAFSPAIESLSREEASEGFSQVEAEEGLTESPVQTFGFSVSVNGPYSSIMKFIKAIENNLRPMKIKKAEFGGGDGADPGVAATLSLETYYQK